MNELTIGEVARLSKVSVRTLHHYDAIGLVKPTGRSSVGYRLYSDEDLERLRRVLFYRELDFGLEAIADMLADPGESAHDHLRRQHWLLRKPPTGAEAMDLPIHSATTPRSGSMTALRRFTGVWPSSTWTTHVSPPTTRGWHRASPGVCTMPSLRTPGVRRMALALDREFGWPYRP
jgi:DNA-binding transcriptional MerR regulator